MEGLHGDAVDQRPGDLQDGLALVGIGLANLFKHIGRHAPAHFSGGKGWRVRRDGDDGHGGAEGPRQRGGVFDRVGA
jgi:hypothetical protein